MYRPVSGRDGKRCDMLREGNRVEREGSEGWRRVKTGHMRGKVNVPQRGTERNVVTARAWLRRGEFIS